LTNIRRHHIPNATVFMTAICAHREKHLEADWSKEMLASVLNEVTSEACVSIIGYVILDDHFHWIVDLSTKKKLPDPTPVGQVATNGSYLTSQLGKPYRSRQGASHPDLQLNPSLGFGPPPVGQVASEASYLTPRMPNDNPTISDLMQSIKLRFTHRYKKTANIRGNVAIWQRRFWDHIIRDQNDHNLHLDYIHFNPVKHGYAARPADYPWSSFGTYLENGIYPPDWGCNGDLPHLTSVNWE
jgi:REP element-mobilizing transposase RayT